ncbi:MAG: hypothetical protein Q9217_005467 [Psora testacea]
MPLRYLKPHLYCRSRIAYQHLNSPPNAFLPATSKRTLIAPPQPNSGPLMTRRSDRALPNIVPSYRIWLKTAPIFIAIITVSALGIFNYQKSSSSVVAATLYALRTSELGRRELGDEIYFRDMWPWIWGEMNQLHGRVNIGYGVKGTKGKGYMRFRSERKTRMGYFETKEWSLETEDGRIVQLLDDGRVDPFKNTTLQAESSD